MNDMPSIPFTYDYRLILLSIVISILASYVALDLTGRLTASRGPIRHAWLLGGALAMGCGIWAMHFTGMLAFRLPIPVYYHVPTVALSLLVAVLASMVALYVATSDKHRHLHVAGGSLAMGAGISAMHYSGMAAMRLAAMHHYQSGLFILSIILAVVISFVGLLLISRFRADTRSLGEKCAAALIMGMAIPVMHYTGMAAVSFKPMNQAPDLTNAVNISSLAIFALLIITFLICGFAILFSLVDRRLSEQHFLLDNERNMLRALIDNIPEFMYVKDLDSRFVVANLHLAQVLGAATPEGVLGKTDFEFFPPEMASAFHADEQEVIRTGAPLFSREEKGIDIFGNEILVQTTKVPLRDSKGQVIGIAGVGRDITARKKMEDELREAELKYRGIFDKAIVGIYQSTPDGRFLSVNPSMAFSCGYASPEEMIANVTDITRQFFANPKRGVEFMLVMDKVGGVKNFECEAVCKDGSKIWLTMSIRAIRQNGAVVRYEGMCEDITERIQLREQLFQAQKLESVGQLAAGIAHEINTPTQYIGDNVRFLQEAFQDLKGVLTQYESLFDAAKHDALSPLLMQQVEASVASADAAYLLSEIPAAIDQTLEGVGRVSTLVSAMKEFSHPGTREKAPLNLNRAIESTITVARNEWKYVAEMESDFDASIPLVSCLPGEFNQVILNLIVNAAHAIADVLKSGDSHMGKIKVQTRNCPKWVEIRIQDSGTGIPEKVRGRVFDPFFTTKEIGKGTGQGLAIARSVIVDKHGGSIHFETEEGCGTTFVIRMPHDGKRLTAKELAV
jgi:PAS domain S-box-containing protein